MIPQLAELPIEIFLAPEILEFDFGTGMEQRFHALIDTLFSYRRRSHDRL